VVRKDRRDAYDAPGPQPSPSDVETSIPGVGQLGGFAALPGNVPPGGLPPGEVPPGVVPAAELAPPEPEPAGYFAHRRELPAGPITTIQAPRGGRWRLRNWRLRWKLLVVLLVPLFTAVGLGGLRVYGGLQNADIYNKINAQLGLSASLSSVIDDVQREAEQVSLYVASGKTAGTGPGGVQTEQVDGAVVDFKQQAATAEAAGNLTGASKIAVNNAEAALNDLGQLRAATATQFPEVSVLTGYSQVLSALFNAAQITQTGSNSPAIYQISNSLAALRQAKQFYTQGNAILMMVAQLNRFPMGTEDMLQSDVAQFQASIDTFNNLATDADREMFADTFVGPSVDQRAAYLATIQATTDTGQLAAVTPPITPAAVQNAGDGAAGFLRNAEINLQNELASTTQSLAGQATSGAVQDGLIVAALLVLAFLITLLVARSLVQSLRRLRSGALDVARTRLPDSVRRILDDPDPIRASSEAVEPIPVFTADEIGEVARSFDVVHGQAVKLAAEQAVLRDNVNAIFVNLSRRSQALVERQLALIDRLERDEQDPDNLANLFELDHLATRMRRNSESLLVLSGSGLAKRMSRPVPIGELVGAAVSEVEQYARIEVGSPPDASVLGRVVNDLIHLIAELLDNATTYSEPNTKVSVRIARTKSRELAIQVTDRGVGMSEEDVRVANESLANPPDIDVSVTRRMGLYVVARLAKRHGIRVKLRTNEDIDGGTVALVVIPEALVHRPGEEAPPAPSGVVPELPRRADSAASADRQAAAAAGIAGAFGMARADAPPEPVPAELSGSPFNFDGELPAEISGPLTQTGYFAPEQPTPVNGSPLPEPADSALDSLGQFGESWQPEASSSAMLWEPHKSVDSGWADDVESTTFNGTMSLDDYSPAGTVSPSHIEVDAPTERLPIYEAVLSQWFRADQPSAEPAAVAAEPELEPAAEPEAEAAQTVIAEPVAEPTVYATPVAQPEPEDAEPAAGDLGLLPTRVPGRAGAKMGFGTTTRSSETNGHAVEPNGHAVESGAESGSDPWHSAADEGWQAAEALLSASVSETTNAGLPKRVPKAQLVPGSAESGRGPDSTLVTSAAGGRSAPLLPPRSADAVRGRMSSFQQGLRRGRHALVEGYSGGASVSSEHQSEEQE